MAITRIKSQDIGTDQVTTIDIVDAAVTFPKLALAASNPCLENAGSDLTQVKVDDSTIERSGSGLRVKADGIGKDQLGILTTKGDLLGFSTEPVRVPVSGNNGNVLVESSGTPPGVSWAPVTDLIVDGDGLDYSGSTLNVDAGDGLKFSTGTLQTALATDGGIEYASGEMRVRGTRRLSGAPGSPQGGDAWYDTSTGRMAMRRGDLTVFTGGVFSVNTSDETQNNSASQLQFTNSNAAISAGEISSSRVFRVTAWGVYSTTGTPTINLRIRVGGTTLAASGAITSVNNAAAKTWKATCTFNIRTSGASAPIRGLFETCLDNAGVIDIAEINTTIDTTAANTFNLSVQFSAMSTSNTMTLQGCIWETFV